MKKSILKKCIAAYSAIESAKDLTRGKLTQCEYFEIGATISEAVQAYNAGSHYIGQTICGAVSEWFVKRGAAVKSNGIGWTIEF